MSTPANTAKRSTFGIGASEIAAIAGLNPYASPWDVWARKVGEQPDDEELPDETSVHTRTGWGHRLEPAIRQAYADETGLEVVVPRSSLFHLERPWCRATPDGIASTADVSLVRMSLLGRATGHAKYFDPDADRLVQIKNVDRFLAPQWEDGPPEYVQLQEQWELYVTGLARADVAALIGGNTYRTFTVYRDDDLIADLVDVAESFWARVQQKRAPEPDASEACAAHFGKRFAERKKGVVLPADVELEGQMARFQALYFASKRTEPQLKLVRAQILAALDGAKADKLESALGTAYVTRTPEKVEQVTNWRLVAELAAASPKPMTSAEFAELVAANTTEVKTAPKVALYAPRAWGKEAKENP